MSVPDYSIFRYIQSVAMPFAYTDAYVPDIALGMDRYVKFGAIAPQTYTLNINDVLEVLLITPNYSLSNSYCKQASLLSKVNPTSTTSLDNRYTFANDVFQEYDSVESPAYLHKASGCVTATGLVKFEGIYYQKSVSDNVSPFSSIVNTPMNPISFNVPANEQLWINSFPCPTEKRVTISDNKPGQCAHHMARFTNIATGPVQITVTGVMLLEKTDPSYTTVPKIMKQTPLGLCGYIFEQLRYNYMFVTHNPTNASALKNKKVMLKRHIKAALSAVISQWQGITSTTSGFDTKKLINFIIFYLE